MTGVPGMAVPVFLVVNAGLAMTFLGGGLLLLIAIWWTTAGDGIEVPRQRWPASVRLGAIAGWLLWLGGLAVQVLGGEGGLHRAAHARAALGLLRLPLHRRRQPQVVEHARPQLRADAPGAGDGVVDQLVHGAQPGPERLAPGGQVRPHPGHVHAQRGERHSTANAPDEHRLTRLHLGASHDHAPCGERDEGKRGGFGPG